MNWEDKGAWDSNKQKDHMPGMLGQGSSMSKGTKHKTVYNFWRNSSLERLRQHMGIELLYYFESMPYILTVTVNSLKSEEHHIFLFHFPHITNRQ